MIRQYERVTFNDYYRYNDTRQSTYTQPSTLLQWIESVLFKSSDTSLMKYLYFINFLHTGSPFTVSDSERIVITEHRGGRFDKIISLLKIRIKPLSLLFIIQNGRKPKSDKEVQSYNATFLDKYLGHRVSSVHITETNVWKSELERPWVTRDRSKFCVINSKMVYSPLPRYYHFFTMYRFLDQDVVYNEKNGGTLTCVESPECRCRCWVYSNSFCFSLAPSSK